MKRQSSGTSSDNEWKRMTISAIFALFWIRKETTAKHPKEDSLNLEEDLWQGPIELRAKISPWEEILTVRSRNGRKSLFADFLQNKYS